MSVTGSNIQQISYIPQIEQHSPFRLMLLHLDFLCSEQTHFQIHYTIPSSPVFSDSDHVSAVMR